MSREVKSIELALENLESFLVEREYIGEFCIDNIKRRISRTACNSISEDFISEEFYIRINSGANTSGIFDRIVKYNDITQIIITYANGDRELLFLTWEESGNAGINECQQSKVSEVNGDLFIVVGKGLTVGETFEYELTEDDNFSWEMYAE